MGDMTARGFALVAAVALAGALTACGADAGPGTPSGSASGSESGSASASSASPTARTQDATALVGSWLVTDAAGAEPGTVLRIADDLSLWQSCGYLMGSWRASTQGLFAGHLDGGDGACFGAGQRDPTPAWLAQVSRFETSGDGAALLASDGSVVARLSPGGKPTPGPHILASLADPPVLSAELAAVLRAPAPLPSSYTPATWAQLLGAWVTVQPRPSGPMGRTIDPGVTFSADGSYGATDGCNGTSGRWAADDSGAFIATGGPSTLIGCANVDVPQFVANAAWAALDDGVLVLVDRAGHETGRLRRP